ncbi:MAG: S8 family serine peptidase [Eubacteriales bacterium]|jgi:hypothetical protein
MRSKNGRRCLAVLLAGLLAGQSVPYVAGALPDVDTQTNASAAKGASTVVVQLGNNQMIVDGMVTAVDSSDLVTPIIRNDRTLLPLRAVSEALGCEVTWNASTSVATVSYEDSSVEFWIDHTRIRVDKTQVKEIDVAPVIVQERTMLPIRYLEELGFVVGWDALTKSAVVSNPYTTNTLVVQMKNSYSITADEAQGGTIIQQQDGRYLIRYNSLKATKAAEQAFAKQAGVEYVQPQRILYTASYNSYVPEKIGADDYIKQMEEDYSDELVKVGLLDTGVEWDHDYFIKRISRGEIDLVEKDNKADDDNGHGTQMAGVIAELTPANVEILPVKVLNSQGRGTDTDIAEGIRYAVEEGVDVIVLGCNATVPECEVSGPIADALDYAEDADIPVVVPAGNERLNTQWSVLSQDSRVFTTVASDEDDQLSTLSNYGSDVLLAAPGMNVKTATLNNRFGEVSGSSISAAVTGAILAMYSMEEPRATVREYRGFLEDHVNDKGTSGKDDSYGYGVLDLSGYVSSDPDDPEDPQEPEDPDEEKSVKSYTFPGTPVRVQKGMSIGLTIREVYTDGSYEDLTFEEASKKGVVVTSSDTDVAKISTDGMLTGIKVGTASARIEYKEGDRTLVNNLEGALQVTEPKEMDYIQFVPSKNTLVVGDTFTVKAYMYYKDGSREELTGSMYSIRSYDKLIVDKISTGEFCALKEGIATLVFENSINWGQGVSIENNVVRVQKPAGMSVQVNGLISEGLGGNNEYITLEDATVKAYDSDGELSQSVQGANNGKEYLLDHLRTGYYTVKIDSEDYNTYNMEARVKDGEVADYTVNMTQTVYSLSGTATLNGKPLAGKALTYTHSKGKKTYSVVTDSNGRFTLPEKFIDGTLTFTYDDEDISVKVRAGDVTLAY